MSSTPQLICGPFALHKIITLIRSRVDASTKPFNFLDHEAH